MEADKPPSTEAAPGLLTRLRHAFRGTPRSRNEILSIVREAQSEAVVDPQEQSMIEGVLDAAETPVRDVMVPRSQMVVLERDDSFESILKIIIDSGHSRFPVIGDDRDDVIGVLLAKDLLRFVSHDAEPPANITRWLRPVAMIPEAKRLNTLLREFRASRSHMAIVVDEYGGVSGLATIEDLLEEIVGEIDDEHDPASNEPIKEDGMKFGSKIYQVDALTRIEDFNEFFGCEWDDEDYDTVGGLVMHELGRLPRRGEGLQFDGFNLVVTHADRRRIERLSAQRLNEMSQG